MTMDHSHSHSHGHGHDHGHGHGHGNEHSSQHNDAANDCAKHADHEDRTGRQEVLRKLNLATSLCFAFFCVEVVGGLLSGSLAVLSDAAHLLADLSAFVVAIAGSKIASMPPNEQHTFGLKRTESLAALFSMVTLVVLSIGLAIEALRRMWLLLFVGADVVVDGRLMSSIAGLGVVVNIVLALVLGEDHAHLPGHDHSHGHGSHENDHESDGHSHSHDEESALLDKVHKKKKTRNVNLHAAYLHVLADLAQSVVVFIAGLVIYWKPSWQLADPICTLVFSVLVCYSTVGVIKSSLSVLLEEVPPHLNWEELYRSICKVKGVTNVHDLVRIAKLGF